MGKATPNIMSNVDFSEAELWDIVFSGGLDLSRVVLPKDGFHILFRNFDIALTRAERATGMLSWTAEQKKEAKILIRAFLVHAKNQPMWILNKKEIIRDLGREMGEELISLLVRFDTEAKQ
jgi:hypothetical protein